MGTECHYFICDVGNREEVYQMAKAVREKVSSLDTSSPSILNSCGLGGSVAMVDWLCTGHLWGLSMKHVQVTRAGTGADNTIRVDLYSPLDI